MQQINTANEQELAILLRALEHLDQAAMLTSLDRHILGFNKQARELFGYEIEEIEHKSTRLFYATEQEYERLGEQRYNEPTPTANTAINVQYVDSKNEVFIGRTHGGLVYDATGTPYCIMTLISDITVQMATEEALNQLHMITSSRQLTFEQRVNAILELGSGLFGLPIGIFSKINEDASEYIIQQAVTPDNTLEPGMTFDLSTTYCSHVFKANDVLGFHHVSKSHIATHPCFKNFGLEAYLGAPIFVDGIRYGTLNFSSPEPCRPFIKQDIELVKLFSAWMGHEIARNYDINALEYAHKRMAHIANTDELTGLANRRCTEVTLEEVIQISIRLKQPLCVAIIDFDNFKHVNDTYGHSAGDDTLKSHSELMKENCRGTDFYGRWGGEEFIAILPNTALEKAIVSLERFRQKAESSMITLDIPELRVTASIGLTELRTDDTLDSLVNRADSLLYIAKESGRNNVQHDI
ncbi:MAG: bifunctional diguanylate cyclase/phosphodiesterase [Vibrio sp.]